MSNSVSATKFRPQTFNELIGQEFVASTLINSINENRIANAYLLSGPRGVGKTSAARIIAKALNCVNGPTGNPCNECENCKAITNGYSSDVIEIDGASNTSINDVREIQEELLYSPINSNYKVYIIDEVHMLSKSAFNALLKTIEEPPERVVFIFATTEINKLMQTVKSRCQEFHFRLIPLKLIAESLIKILNFYNIQYEIDAINWIANEGKGSMRDAYTLLDQIVSFSEGNITLNKIKNKLKLTNDEDLLRLINGVVKAQREVILNEYYSLLENGISPEQIVNDLIHVFRNILFKKLNLSNSIFISNTSLQSINSILVSSFTFEDIEIILDILFKTFTKNNSTIDPIINLEIALLKIAKYKTLIRPSEIISKLENLEKNLITSETTETFSQMPPDSSLPNQTNTIINPINNNNELQSSNSTNNSLQNNSKAENSNIKIETTKSAIINLIKKRLFNDTKHTQLLLALDNVNHIEETTNNMKLFFAHQIYSDYIKNDINFLTNQIRSIVDHDYIIEAIYDPELKKIHKTIAEINKKRIISVFDGKEL